MQTLDIVQFAQRPDGMAAGLSRGSAPSRYSILAMTQYPVAANQTIAPPTNTINEIHQALCASAKTDATEILNPTTR